VIMKIDVDFNSRVIDRLDFRAIIKSDIIIN
jgi:hypothetical protein